LRFWILDFGLPVNPQSEITNPTFLGLRSGGGQMIRLPKLSELQPRERLLAACSGVVLLVVLLDRLVLSPWLHHAHTVREEARQMESALQKYQRLLSRKDQVLADLEAHRRYLHPRVEDELAIASLLQELEGIAQTHGVKLSEIKPQPTVQGELATRYTLDVRFECQMEEWVDFIFGIETSNAPFGIAQAALSVSDETPDRLEGYVRVVSVAAATGEPAAGASAPGRISAVP
jgi:Tfp pilus assembly protein PilO